MGNSSSDLAITSKRLGLILLAMYCARCFWYLLKQRFHPPFDHFGGAIFTAMEQAQLAVVADQLERNGALPKQFAPFTDLVSQVDFPRDWRKFQHRLKSGVLLYGVPDGIYKRADESIVVVDHKTADPDRKGAGDPLVDCYRCQVTGYALIAQEGLKLGQVSEGGLFYWTADHKSVIEAPNAHYDSKGLHMNFVPKPIPVDIDYGLLDAPLKEAQRLWALTTPPEGRENCPDCKKLDALFAIEEEARALQSSADQRMIQGSGNDSWIWNSILIRRTQENRRRMRALYDLRDEANALAFADDGVISNWEEYV